MKISNKVTLSTFTLSLFVIGSYGYDWGFTTVELYWNKSNELFTDGYNSPPTLKLRLRDKLIFHCPLYDKNSAENMLKEYYTIYRVPKRYYDTCSIPSNKHSRKLSQLGIYKVHICNNPSHKSLFSTVIERFTALPGSHGGLTYQPGQSYYFISMSTGTQDGLDNKNSNLSSCELHNMKLKLDVCCSSYTSITASNSHDDSQSTVQRNLLKAEHSYDNHFTNVPHFNIEATTMLQKPKFPQAIIDAEVLLESSSNSLFLSLFALVFGLLVSIRHNII